jgi:CTP-dependent riboflavin kinase
VWPGLVRGRTRPYWFWPAWLNGRPVHALDPAGRGHGPDSVEVVAPVRLRDRLGLVDGDTVTLEVARDS